MTITFHKTQKLDLHSKKSHYSEAELTDTLSTIDTAKQFNLIDILSVLSYFNREEELKNLKSNSSLNFGDNLNKMYIFKEYARAFKNLGKYEIASSYYCDLLQLELDKINNAYCLTLFSKFLSDYYQRKGFNQSLLSIAFNRINVNFGSTSRQQMSALRVIFDSYKKEFGSIDRLKITNKYLENEFSNTVRIQLNNLEFELSQTEIEQGDFRNKFLEAIRLVEDQKQNGNEKSFGEKTIKLLSIYRKKDFELNDDIVFDSKISGLRTNLDSIIANGKYLNDRKMICGALKEQLIFDVEDGDIKSAISKFESIKDILWKSNQIIYLPHYLLECLKKILEYSISIQDSSALDLASQFLELNQILLNQLLKDEAIFRDSEENRTNENLFSIVKEKLTPDEQKMVQESFRKDYSILLRNFQDALSDFKRITYLKQIFDESKLSEELLNHNIHDFSSELKKIKEENEKYKDENIRQSVDRLYEITNKWEKDKNELKEKEIVLATSVDRVIEIASGYNDFQSIVFQNNIDQDIIIKFSEPILKMIIWNLTQNISLHKDRDILANVKFNFRKIDEFGYLIIEDNIGGISNFKQIIKRLNENSDNEIKSKLGSGKALKNNYRTLKKIVSDSINLKIIQKSDLVKELLIPLEKYS